MDGIGSGVKNYMAYGGFPLDDDWNETLFPRGIIIKGDLGKVYDIDILDIARIPASALFPTLGRTAARCIEGKLVADSIENWVMDPIANLKGGDQRTWTRCDIPNTADGRSMTEAPRGALGHWINIKNKVIASYQAVVPTTWNEYLMANIRFAHLVFGFLLTALFTWRIYLAFFSRFHADWKEFFAWFDLKNTFHAVTLHSLLIFIPAPINLKAGNGMISFPARIHLKKLFRFHYF